MTVLVTGGAGYIGSHMVKMLRAAGRPLVVLDNLSTGHRDAVLPGVDFVRGDTADAPLIAELLRAKRVSAVIHFAAFSQVGESTADPLKYYANNVAGTVGLLRAMRDAGVERLVFSSTAAPPRSTASRKASRSTRSTPRRPSTPTARASSRSSACSRTCTPRTACAR
jgi:UDP-glucose 4-epimerase